jgi:hypothetical protein
MGRAEVDPVEACVTGVRALLAVAAAVTAAVGVPAPATSDAPVEVFVLAGQSNMVGRGFPLSDGEAAEPAVVEWKDGGWNVASDPLADPSDPESGVGPGMTFAEAVAAAEPGVTVGLVMCAKGGTSIADWRPTGDLYRRCILRVRAGGVQVAGVLFLQGEADAKTKEKARAWGRGFAAVYAAFTRDLHPTAFLLGQTGTLPKAWKGQETVRAQQAQAATRYRLPLVATAGLPTGADGVHFTVAGYKQVGARFAAAWLGSRTSVRLAA